MAFRPPAITTVILAGGLGSRMGGNKGLQLLHGRTLIGWVHEVVSRDSQEVLINVNRDQGAYVHFGCRLIADQIPDRPGPLAGLHAALLSARTDLVMTVPCDTPFLPKDVILRLADGLRSKSSEVSVASAGGGGRQPTIALYNKSVLPKLLIYLGSGGRKVNDWLNTLSLSEVVFDNVDEFDNINTPDDLARAGKMINMAQARLLEISQIISSGKS